MARKSYSIPSSAMFMALLILCAFTNVFADNNSSKDGYKDFSIEREFVGTVTPLTVSSIPYGFNDEYRGEIYYTPGIGTIFDGPRFDLKGNIIKQGDPIIKIYPSYRESRVKKSQASLDTAKANLNFASAEYERDSKLVKRKSVSVKEFQQAESNYYAAKAAVASAECDLNLANELLKICTYYAQFDGIVTQVLMCNGYCSGEPKILELTQLQPIGVTIKMDRTLANQITVETPVTIYPDPSISKDPIGVLHGFQVLTSDGITLYLSNDGQQIKIIENGKEIPNIHNIHNILAFDYNPSICGVNINALKKDDKGYYLWKGVGQKNSEPGKGLSRVFSIEKIYVIIDDLVDQMSPSDKFVKLKDPGGLQVGDICVKNVPEGSKNGDKVCFVPLRFIFMPGDVVKVKIGPNP
jgi:hypothetical protein